MKYSLIIRPEAREEIEQAFDWYQSRRDGLGFEFEGCLEEALARILRDPESYAAIFDDVCRVPVRRFPFGIFYRTTGSQVAVIAVYHSQRDLKRLHERE
jgi:plasmid stabilization system protein ParE